MSFHNKTIILSGANSALGQALAKQLSKLSTKLALVDRDQTALEALQTEVTQADSEIIIIANDFLEENAALEVVNSAISSLGQVDILINVASDLKLRPFQSLSAAQLAQEMYSEAILPMMLSHAVLPSFVQQQAGYIANVGNFYSTLGLAETANSAANNHALMGFSQALHEEFKAQGITVSYIGTKPIKTAMIDETQQQRFAQKQLQIEAPIKMANLVLDAIFQAKTLHYPDRKSNLLAWINRVSPTVGAYLMDKNKD